MRETFGVDAVIRGRLSRRAFVMLAAAGMVGLAGCASSGQGVSEPSDTEGEKPEDDAPEEGSSDQGAQGAEAAAQADAEPVKGSTFAYNTLVSITAYGVDESVVHDCLAACAEYEGLFSARKAGTDVDRINNAGGQPVEVDPRTADLIAEALEFCENSDGAFDVTIGSVSLLWDFMEAVKPSDEAIAEGVAHIDYTKVAVEGTTVTMADPDARLDLGGIAKGWICRALTERLVEAGATAALVNLGTSSVYAHGIKPDGSKWRIGLTDPLDSGGSLLGVVELADISITSSGLYDQKFEQDGVEYWHILDKGTGYPAQTDMLGDTLLCEDPVFGDATSTTMFVKGMDEAASWIERNHPQVPAMFVGEGDEQVFVNGFEGYVAE